jgi:hypothetical protein
MSPDPTIRAVALRRKAIDVEATRLDGFLSLYSELPSTGDGSVPIKALDQVLAQPSPRITGDFIAMARATLREAGRPLKLADFYAAFWRRLPGMEPCEKDSFRQRLLGCREHISLDRQVGYWIAGEPVPGQANNVDASE